MSSFFYDKCCQVFVSVQSPTITLPYVEDLPEISKSRGSGFVIKYDDTNLICTNFHVVNGCKDVSVAFSMEPDNKIPAEIVFVNPHFDLAFLKVSDFKNLKPLELGKSNHLTSDNPLYAVGYPLGLKDVQVHQGFKTGLHNTPEETYIQHSVALNPGNSGGPLLVKDSHHGFKVVGINNAIIKDAQQIDFAIPIERLKTVLDNHKIYKNTIQYPFNMGVEFQQANKPLKDFYVGSRSISGIFVKKVTDSCLFKENDLLINVNGLDISDCGHVIDPRFQSALSLEVYLSYEPVGEYIEFSVIRDKSPLAIELHNVASTQPKHRRWYPPFEKIDYEIIAGVVLTDITDNAVEELGASVRDGVVVVNVLQQGEVYHEQTGVVSPGTVITKIGNQKFEDLNELRDYLHTNPNPIILTTETGDKLVISTETVAFDNELIGEAYGLHTIERFKNSTKPVVVGDVVGEVSNILSEMDLEEISQIEKEICGTLGLEV